MPRGNEECPTCRGTGFLVRDLPYGHHEFSKPVGCPTCHDGELARRLSEASQLTGWLRQARLTNYDVTPENGDAFVAIRDYSNDPHGLLTLWGANGVGKTHLLAALVNRLTEQRVGAVYYTLPDLLDVLREAVGADQFAERIQRLFTVHVLAIDELDKARLTDWAQEQLYRLVDTRYRDHHRLGTLFAMNVAPANLTETPYLYSRMSQGKVIQVGGGDMRPTIGRD